MKIWLHGRHVDRCRVIVLLGLLKAGMSLAQEAQRSVRQRQGPPPLSVERWTRWAGTGGVRRRHYRQHWAETLFSVPVPKERVRDFEAVCRLPARRGDPFRTPFIYHSALVTPNWWYAARPAWYVQFFTDPEPRVRRAAVMASKGPVEEVYGLLDDPDLDVVDGALWAILRKGGLELRHPLRLRRALDRVLANWAQPRCMGLRAIAQRWAGAKYREFADAVLTGPREPLLAALVPAAAAPDWKASAAVQRMIGDLYKAEQKRLKVGSISHVLKPVIERVSDPEVARVLLALVRVRGVPQDIGLLKALVSNRQTVARPEDIVAAAFGICDDVSEVLRQFGPWIESEVPRERAAARVLVTDRHLRHATMVRSLLRGEQKHGVLRGLSERQVQMLLAVPLPPRQWVTTGPPFTFEYRFADPLPEHEVLRFEYECFRSETTGDRDKRRKIPSLLPHLRDKRPRVVEAALRTARRGGEPYLSSKLLASLMAEQRDRRCRLLLLSTWLYRSRSWKAEKIAHSDWVTVADVLSWAVKDDYTVIFQPIEWRYFAVKRLPDLLPHAPADVRPTLEALLSECTKDEGELGL